MNVAIIGTGNVGSALAEALRRNGHQVLFGVRAPDPTQPDQASVATAVEPADATILAIPFTAAAEVIAAGSGFAGKVRPRPPSPMPSGFVASISTIGHTTSGAEQIAALAPMAHVFKAFNQTGFENMADARPYAARPVMFVAGADAAGKQTVLTLVADCGFEPVDAGDLRAARLLEPLAMLWIELARKRGQGPHFTFTLQRKA